MARCCKAAALTLAIGLSTVWAVGSVKGSAAEGTAPGTRGHALQVRDPHVVVLKSKRLLHLFDGADLVRTYPIALGPNPVGDKVRLGDGRTPEGLFRICNKKLDSQYERFLGIDYPTSDVARRGLSAGLLTVGEARSILDAAVQERCPPWTTPVGGAIGIHGYGTDGTDRSGDWTAGCIAVSNAHLRELFGVLRIGDRVEILP
ncbi:MAG TPA: L,D-transpeptidase [Phycisphaerae bacterium]|nr:L,D-transpeptidase [Phycisphaerae bacterium]